MQKCALFPSPYFPHPHPYDPPPIHITHNHIHIPQFIYTTHHPSILTIPYIERRSKLIILSPSLIWNHQLPPKRYPHVKTSGNSK